MRKPLPYIAGEIRSYLQNSKEFTDLLHGGKISTRLVPDDLQRPHVLVATTGHVGADPMARRLVVQVTPWVPGTEVSHLDEDPDVTAWNLAAMAGEILGRAKNVTIDAHTAWNATWIDGPVQLFDLKRGADKPLFYAPVRFQIHVRHRAQIS
ncbi:hypothetical protein WG936_05485 [Corynebacterium sp. H127]|uniref:hypothetical protein n=1 Tax=Corynebacterium sp. H127 TaxID=3133418 RepID=UPI00309EF56F